MKVTLLDIKEPRSSLSLPLYTSHVPAGFPSPADDYIEENLDLNEYLVKHPVATFYARTSGQSMINAGILDKSLLIVDRSIQPAQNDIVIASVDGELTCKILDKQQGLLRAANLNYKPISIAEGIDCTVIGVVVHVINTLCTHS